MRLTKRGAISQRDINNLLEYSNDNQTGKNDVYYKLQHYEDMEEQGLLTVIDNETFQRDNLDRCTHRHCNKCDKYRRDLQRYKDLEEQCKLKELPCAVGDMAYQVINLNNKFQVEPVIITEIAYNMNDYYKLIGYRTIIGGEIHYSSNAIGRTLFFTSEEAEAKLKEMEGVE